MSGKAKDNRALALRHAKRGWHVFPVQPTKAPYPGTRGFKDATRDAEQIGKWWDEHPDALVGVPTFMSGVSVMDLDVNEHVNGIESASTFGLYGHASHVFPSLSGKGEHHLFLGTSKTDKDIVPIGETSTGGTGIDLRGLGGYVVAMYDLPKVAKVTEPLPESLPRPKATGDATDERLTDEAFREWREAAPAGGWSAETRTAVESIGTTGEDRKTLHKALCSLAYLAAEGAEGIPAAMDAMVDRYMTGWEGHKDAGRFRKDAEDSMARAAAVAGRPGSNALDDLPIEEFKGMTAEERKAASDQAVLAQKVAEERERRAIRREADRLDALEVGAGAPSILDAFMTLEDLGNMPEPEPLVGTLVGRGQTAMIVAESNTGKTFLTVAMAHAVATGVPFAGHPVHQGRVLFVIGEDENGMKSRMEAVQTARGAIDVDMLDLVRVPFNLDDERAVEMIEEKVRTREYALIVLDPLARFIVNMDENDPTGMGVAMATLDRLRRANDQASIVVAHHTNKGGAYRGATSIYAAMDTVVGMKKAGDAIALTLDKSKSSATGDIGTYQLQDVPGTRSVILDKVHAAQAREVLETMPEGKKDEVLQMFARHWPSTTQASRAEVQSMAAELQVASKSTVNRAIEAFTKSGHLEYVNGGKNVRLTDQGRYYVEAVTDPLNP